MMNKTDLKIVKLWRRGNHSFASLARKIGRPGTEGMKRVKNTLIRERIINEQISKFRKVFNYICDLRFLRCLGRAEGTNKNWRRFLIPFTLSGLAYGHLRDWRCILIMAMMGAFSMGYGIPDLTDEGSGMGRFFYRICHKNALLANIFTRATIGFMVSLSLIWIPILKENWLTYLVCSLIVMSVYGSISWKDLGGYWFKGKYLLLVDTIVYGTIGLVSTIMIYF